MLRYHINIAWRNLWKHKLYTSINIVGLSVGIGACLLIFLFVHYELTYDQHNVHFRRIARITTTLSTPESDLAFATSPYPLADIIRREYPETEAVVRLESSPAVVPYKNELIREKGFYAADQSVFSIFTFSFIVGSAHHALTAPNTLILTESIARKYFNSPDRAFGNTLLCNGKPHRITGVIADLPTNTDLHIEGLLSANFSDIRTWTDLDFPVYTFALLKKGTNLKRFESKLQRIATQYVQPELNGVGANDYRIRFQTEPLASVHFSQRKLMDTVKGNKHFNNVFSLLALLILLIALLNYVNLSTAAAMERNKEVGIRKVAGARPIQLIRQFVIESFLLIATAWVIATMLVSLLIPYFNHLLGTAIAFEWQEYGLFLLGVFVLTTLLAAIYPSLTLARYGPIGMLKKSFKTSIKGIIFRKGIVIVQFAMATAMIIGTIVVYRQVEYVTNTDLGFNLNQIVSVRVPTDSIEQTKVKGFYESLKQLPEVEGVTMGSGLQADDLTMATTFAKNNGQRRELMSNYFLIDPYFAPLLKLHFVAGRNLSDSLHLDREQAFLVNESFLHEMGWKEAIGQPLEGFGHKGKVVGVVKNFYYKSMHNLVEPLVMIYNTFPATTISLRINSHSLSKVKDAWTSFFPNRSFRLYLFR
ncbi:ABC transporter permease [Olivibacter sp. 47]|uniref:ABC transporter permease n=1 Tax=Olivibacter sp. 47 TaxID=3056486 RepID=UPI0025A387D0|nr:ABC transporter permease [Olivibacter sp. 47]MDM8173036.1 ABC transporter permease [Olivibacter sp. 47]